MIRRYQKRPAINTVKLENSDNNKNKNSDNNKNTIAKNKSGANQPTNSSSIIDENNSLMTLAGQHRPRADGH
jgi:hypothetical protein